MAIRVNPGTEKTHECRGHKKSESRNGTQFAEIIMASGKATLTGRTQDSTRPRHAATSKRTCKKGAIHTGTILFALGSIQLLPVIRRRAAERGLSGGIAIPLILAVIGFVVFMVEAFELRLI